MECLRDIERKIERKTERNLHLLKAQVKHSFTCALTTVFMDLVGVYRYIEALLRKGAHDLYAKLINMGQSKTIQSKINGFGTTVGNLLSLDRVSKELRHN